MRNAIRRAATVAAATLSAAALAAGLAATPAAAATEIVACSEVRATSMMPGSATVCLMRDGSQWWATAYVWYHGTVPLVLRDFDVTLIHTGTYLPWLLPLASRDCGAVLAQATMSCSTHRVTVQDSRFVSFTGWTTLGIGNTYDTHVVEA